MDKALRAHQLGSAASRKLKAEQRDLWMQKLEARRRLLWGYDSDEEELSGDDSPVLSPVTDSPSNESTSPLADRSPIVSSSLNAPFSSDGCYFEMVDKRPKGFSKLSRVHREDLGDAGDLMPSTPPSTLNLSPSILLADDPSTPSIYDTMSGGEEALTPPTSPSMFLDYPIEVAKSIQYLIPIAKPSIVSVRQSSPTRRNSLKAINSPVWSLSEFPPPPRSEKRDARGLPAKVKEPKIPIATEEKEPILSMPRLDSNDNVTKNGRDEREDSFKQDLQTKDEPRLSPSMGGMRGPVADNIHDLEVLAGSSREHDLRVKKQRPQSIFVRPSTSHGTSTKSSIGGFTPFPPSIVRASSDLTPVKTSTPLSKPLEEIEYQPMQLPKPSRKKSLMRSKSRKERKDKTGTFAGDDLEITSGMSSLASSPTAGSSQFSNRTHIMDYYPWPHPPNKSSKNGIMTDEPDLSAPSLKSSATSSPIVGGSSQQQSKPNLMDYYPWPNPLERTQGNETEDVDMPTSSGITGLGVRKMASRRLLKHIVFEHELASVTKQP